VDRFALESELVGIWGQMLLRLYLISAQMGPLVASRVGRLLLDRVPAVSVATSTTVVPLFFSMSRRSGCLFWYFQHVQQASQTIISLIDN
jgi:hypothetical protein